jgi:hypothetical protein
VLPQRPAIWSSTNAEYGSEEDGDGEGGEAEAKQASACASGSAGGGRGGGDSAGDGDGAGDRGGSGGSEAAAVAADAPAVVAQPVVVHFHGGGWKRGDRSVPFYGAPAMCTAYAQVGSSRSQHSLTSCARPTRRWEGV